MDKSRWSLIIFLAIAAILLLMPRAEAFAEAFAIKGGLGNIDQVFPGRRTSKSIYKNGNYATDAAFYAALKENALVMDDKDDLLQMNRCIQFMFKNDEDWATSLTGHARNANMFVDLSDVTTTDFQTVRAKIVTSLQSRVDANGGRPIPGPVYVLISQAPFYRDAKGQTISIQFNAANYGMDYYNKDTSKAGAPTVVVKTAVFYPMVLTNGSYAPKRTWSDVSASLGWLLGAHSKDMTCFLTCAGDATMFCGCKNQNAPYTSRCLGPSGPKDTEKGALVDTVVAYTINSSHKLMKSGSITAWAPMNKTTPCTPPSQQHWLLGVGVDEALHTRASATSPWVPVPKSCGVKKAIVLQDGRILGIGLDKNLWLRKALHAAWEKAPGRTCCVISVCELKDGRWVGVGTDNKLYLKTKPATDDWVLVNGGKTCCVKDVVQMTNGELLGVGTDNQLYTCANLTSAWVKVGGANTCCVTSIAAMPDGSILGVGTDSKVYKRAKLAEAWKVLDGATSCCMQSITPWLAAVRVRIPTKPGAKPGQKPGAAQQGALQAAPKALMPVAPTAPAITYGAMISIKALASRWGGHDGYLSPCGGAGGCGVGVTLRPDNEFTKHEPNSYLRKWKLSGGSVGKPVKYGDVVEIKGQATRWGGHDGYLSPCGGAGGCGIDVTLRPDVEFFKHEPNSNLRRWQILGGATGTPIPVNGIVEIKALASRWAGADGYLSPCGSAGGCGINVTLRPDNEFTKHEPNSMLRKWKLIV